MGLALAQWRDRVVQQKLQALEQLQAGHCSKKEMVRVISISLFAKNHLFFLEQSYIDLASIMLLLGLVNVSARYKVSPVIAVSNVPFLVSIDRQVEPILDYG